jgi:hypothetical protein
MPVMVNIFLFSFFLQIMIVFEKLDRLPITLEHLQVGLTTVSAANL